jgi:hypothetical protein
LGGPRRARKPRREGARRGHTVSRGTADSPRRQSPVFHPLTVLLCSLAGAAAYALYAARRFSGEGLHGQLSYVVPIVVPFVAFLFDRAARRRRLGPVQFGIDALIVGTATARAFGLVPFVSGHALFLTYCLFGARSRVARATSALVLLQVVYLKYLVWHDPVTPTSGLVLGALAALVARRVGARAGSNGGAPPPDKKPLTV